MEIRQLAPSDAATYREVRLKGLRESPTAFGSSYDEEVQLTLDEYVERIAPDSEDGQCTFGAFEGQELVGALSFGRPTAANLRHCAILWGMYVDPEFRGRGIGRALLRAAITHARSVKGLRQIKLAVNATNKAARELYRSVGFELFGVEPEAFLVEDKYYDEEYYILRIETDT